MNYFIYQDDQERGPYPIDELIKSVNAGYIEPSTMAREEDSDQWMEVSAVIAQRQKQRGQEQQARDKRERKPREIIGTFQSPNIVNIHYISAKVLFGIAVPCLFLGFFIEKDAGTVILGFTGLISCISCGIGLFIAGYIIDCLSECAFRLRNIEFNTAKAAEKN